MFHLNDSVIIRLADYDNSEASLCSFPDGIDCMLMLMLMLMLMVISMQYTFLMLDE
ncbi:hypothetical protein VCRA2116O30_100054 [Vibrio crassostreae]|nr:hypothetical protein VCRA2119O45_100054 [Vibrio crassostreae]CAK1697593.1 hypothetical protein VCRA2116O30_100054 [Vibrio crassostreae]CAK1859844.1 hypothetical protein VCRA2118O41_10316 [Vibrio crassostreae]CAK1872798.1 hypothetical protein VCRA2119O46_10335 [Vibrio crassostreae]CAK1880520.1 hypothetical protein VCRA2116O31_10351 [Vibrio crassostreae]